MKRDEVLATLVAHQEELKGFGVSSLALFGSVIWDIAEPKSDVDILVEFDRPVGLFQYARLRRYLESVLKGARVDLVVRSAVLDELREDIFREAVDVF